MRHKKRYRFSAGIVLSIFLFTATACGAGRDIEQNNTGSTDEGQETSVGAETVGNSTSENSTFETEENAEIDGKSNITLGSIPANYYSESSHAGVLERFSYQTADDANGGTRTKEVIVYLPFGYDESDMDTRYTIMYLMHGGGGSETTYMGSEPNGNRLKNIIDHMIENQDIEPMIFVMPTFDTSNTTDALVETTQTFYDELVNDLIPSVETEYHTYAEDITEEGITASRNQRIFGGFSMGGTITWSVFSNAMQYFRYYLPMSGDSWAVEFYGGRDSNAETVRQLYQDVLASGYTANDYCIFAATGTADMAYDMLPPQVETMLTYPDTFVKTETDFSEGNLMLYLVEGNRHDYSYTYEYIYNGLRLFAHHQTDHLE